LKDLRAHSHKFGLKAAREILQPREYQTFYMFLYNLMNMQRSTFAMVIFFNQRISIYLLKIFILM